MLYKTKSNNKMTAGVWFHKNQNLDGRLVGFVTTLFGILEVVLLDGGEVVLL